MKVDLASIQRDFESDLERISEDASLRFNAAVKATLDNWSRRYTRHKFHAWEGHGLMSIDVSPKICGQDSLELMNPKDYRGAIAELVIEARALVDCHINSDQRVGLFCADYKTKDY